MQSCKKFLSLLMLVFAVLGLVAWGVKWTEMSDEVVAEAETEVYEGLPKIEIDLNGVDLDTIKGGGKKVKYPGNSVTISDATGVTEYGDVEVKGRGNTTWYQDKKPYQLKFANKVDLLGNGATKKWVLLANYLDTSYVRSDAAFAMAEMLGAEFVQRGEFVELYFDGEYEGLYYLLKKVEIGKGAVDIRDEKGVLVELDNLHLDGDTCYEVYGGNCLSLKDAVTKDEATALEAMGEFMDDFNELEVAAEEGDYPRVAELADVRSLVNYYLVNEFTVNPDAYSTSFYWYKDGERGKIHAGPVWDFDFSMANRKWTWMDSEEFFSPNVEMARRGAAFGDEENEKNADVAKLFYWLMDMPEFRAEVEQVFRENLSGREDELEKLLKIDLRMIEKAAMRDSERWGLAELEAESGELLNWLEARYEFMEKMYGNGSAERESVL